MKIIAALTGYTYDTYPFFVLDINNVLYLFNMPDNCSRIFSDSSYSITKVKRIFLSSLSLSDTGGLLGSLIAILKPWKNKIEITCPNFIKKIFENNEFFAKMKKEYLPILTDEFYSDDLIAVNMIMTGQSVSYSIQCSGCQGRFLPEKAKKLGIKPGPNFSKLKAGETLYNEKGEAVTLADCISEPIQGEKILIMNITREEDIEFIPSEKELNEFNVIVHMTPIKIVNNDKYLARFPMNDKVKHVCFGFSGRVSYKTASILFQNFVDYSNELLKPLSTCEDEINGFPSSFINLSTGDSFIFSPSNKMKVIHDEEYKKIEKYSNFNCPLPLFESFAVTFLGSGSANPVKCRGDPGILIHTKSGFIALDTGEGYIQQLHRKYGRENSNYILKNLSLIFITHNHCDHSFGLRTVLEARSSLTNEKVQLFCDKNLLNEMKFYESLNQNISFNIDHIDSQDEKNKEFNVNENIKIKTVNVCHTNDSKGCLITIENRWKVAYSGDRKALGNDLFVEEFGEVDLLIHEATFCSELDTEMDDYDHSTVNHAIDVQKQMNAKYMALVHFSQRYDQKYIHCPAEKAFVTFDYLDFAFENIEEVCKMVKRVNIKCLEHD